LCDNACQYTATGDRIIVGSRIDDDTLRFWVRDTGPGISAEDQTRIFERFSRGTAGGNRTDGAGLGLSIVSAIAAAHGGRIDLNSAPGHGATFTIVMPAVIPAEGEDSWPES
jgi:signal transduction histidine kinase